MLTLLLIKMAVTASIVVMASVAAERLGPIIGGVVLSLPLSAGPGYIFLALDNDPAFIAKSALFSAAGNTSTFSFIAGFALAPLGKSMFGRLGSAFLAWLATAALIRLVDPDAIGAILFNVVGYAGSLWATRNHKLAQAVIPKPTRVIDLLGRAVGSGSLIATVVSVSTAIGPAATGVSVIYPINLTTLGIIFYRRYGGEVAAAMLVASLPPMIGFAACALTVHWLAEPLGSWTALALGFCVSVAWGLLLIARYRLARSRKA